MTSLATPPRAQNASIGADGGVGGPPLRLWFGLILGAMTLIRLGFIGSLPLSGDEAYHWEWSRHLAPSYWDHPGMTAWLIRLGTELLPGEAGVRLPAVLCLTGTALVAFALAQRVARQRGCTATQADRAGLIAGTLVLFVPIFAVFGVYISTDPPLLFFATLTWWALAIALETGRWSAWLGAGVALGLAASAKFLAFTIPAAAGLTILAHRDYRCWLLRPHPYAALAATALAFGPVLWWNAENAWGTFDFNFSARHGEIKWSPLLALEFLGGQAVMLLPLVFGFAVLALYQAGRRTAIGDPSNSAPGLSKLMLLASVVPLTVFGLVSFTRRIGMHWTTSCWVPALVLLAVDWAQRDPGPGAGRRRAMRWTIGTTAGVTMLMHFIAHVPPTWTDFDLAYVGWPERIRIKAFDERYGWEQLGAAVDRTMAEMRDEDPSREVILLGAHYGVAAIASFYTPGRPQAHLWSPPRDHGASYFQWDDFPALRGTNAVLVAKRQWRLDVALKEARAHFARVDPPEELSIRIDRLDLRPLYLIRCWDFDGDTPF
ncbi:MAG: glycosyltransferase family 39 protein [Planctomycetota bacterium]